ncbi:hypothetical protein CTI14_64655, partial [Methylobacterium radiotolerans]
MSDVIALIFDFDDTLASDSTSGFLVIRRRRHIGHGVRAQPLPQSGKMAVVAFFSRIFMSDVIALIFDFDDTLASDSTSGFLVIR